MTTLADELKRIASYEPSELERATWDAWLSTVPERVRNVAEKLKPWRLYRMKSTGALVVIHCVDEPEDESLPVTLKVDVTRALNENVLFDRRVFRVPPEELEEFDPTGGAS